MHKIRNIVPRVFIILVGLAVILLTGIRTVNLAYKNVGMVFASHFLFSPTASPDDFGLLMARQVFENLLGHASYTNTEVRERLRGLYDRNTHPEFAAYFQGRRTVKMAHALREKGKLTEAVTAFQEAAGVPSVQIQLEAHLGMADLMLETGDAAGYESAMRVAQTLLLSQMASTPVESSSKPIAALVDTKDLMLQVPVHIILAWQIPADYVSHQGTFWGECDIDDPGAFKLYSWQNLLILVGEVDNLLDDGGFESLLAPRNGTNSTFPTNLYEIGDRWLSYIALQYDSMSQIPDIVLNIRGNQGKLSGVSSNPTPIAGTACDGYLVTGEYQSSSDARPLIGIRWLLSTAQTWNDNVSSYLVTEPAQMWTRFRDILRAPQDATDLQFWIINTNPGGHLQVDNLGVFSVPLPCFARENTEC